MCFSAPASFITGAALSAVGGATLAQVKTRREIPFASIPLLLGVQQLIEGVVWLSFDSSSTVHAVATFLYSSFAFVLWPILVPFSVFLLEKDRLRTYLLLGLSFVGAVLGFSILSLVTLHPVTSSIINRCIAYDVPSPYPLTMMALYVLVTCGSCLVSSHKSINVFGFALVVSLGVSLWFFYTALFSVWCFFAAIMSMIVYWHFKSVTLERY